MHVYRKSTSGRDVVKITLFRHISVKRDNRIISSHLENYLLLQQLFRQIYQTTKSSSMSLLVFATRFSVKNSYDSDTHRNFVTAINVLAIVVHFRLRCFIVWISFLIRIHTHPLQGKLSINRFIMPWMVCSERQKKNHGHQQCHVFQSSPDQTFLFR